MCGMNEVAAVARPADRTERVEQRGRGPAALSRTTAGRHSEGGGAQGAYASALCARARQITKDVSVTEALAQCMRCSPRRRVARRGPTARGVWRLSRSRLSSPERKCCCSRQNQRAPWMCLWRGGGAGVQMVCRGVGRREPERTVR